VICLTDRADSVEARIARALAARFDLHRLHRSEPTLEGIFLHYIEAPRAAAQ
jgi:hypothetical protein